MHQAHVESIALTQYANHPGENDSLLGFLPAPSMLVLDCFQVEVDLFIKHINLV